MSNYKSKLPLKIQAKLAKELKTLYAGKTEKIKVRVEFDQFIKIGYGLDISEELCDMIIHESSQNDLFNKAWKRAEEQAKINIQTKINDFNIKIKEFNEKFKKLCSKYDCDEEEEYELIYSKHKLYKLSNKWQDIE